MANRSKKVEDPRVGLQLKLRPEEHNMLKELAERGEEIPLSKVDYLRLLITRQWREKFVKPE